MFPNERRFLWTLTVVFAGVALSSVQGRSQRVISSPDIPVTGFSCSGRPPGYYADVETGCQVYHMCAAGGQQFSYKCPNTTLFQQRMLICAHWYQVNCSRSESHYGANLLIGQRDKPFVNENENTYYINRKQVGNLTNPDVLQHLAPSGGDNSDRKPKHQSHETHFNNLEKFNLKRSDSHSVGNLGRTEQNSETNVEQSTFSSVKNTEKYVEHPTFTFGQNTEKNVGNPTFTFGQNTEKNVGNPTFTFRQNTEKNMGNPTFTFGQNTEKNVGNPTFTFGQNTEKNVGNPTFTFGQNTEKNEEHKTFTFGQSEGHSTLNFAQNSRQIEEHPPFNPSQVVTKGLEHATKPLSHNGVQNVFTTQKTTHYNSFNTNTFPTTVSILPSRSSTLKGPFNQQFHTFLPTSTTRQFNTNNGVNTNFVTTTEGTRKDFEILGANKVPQVPFTSTTKPEHFNLSPAEINPPEDFQPPSLVSEVGQKTKEYSNFPNDEYNVFINRFNPNEATQTTTTAKPEETTEYFTFINRFNPNIDGTYPVASESVDSEKVQPTSGEGRVIKIPVFELEPPFQDSDESDSNQIELHFKDPRRTFFIPDSGSKELSSGDDIPIVVTIPLHTVSDSPPMWFKTDKSKDPCSRCHPSFVVNKNNCMPCVIIR